MILSKMKKLSVPIGTDKAFSELTTLGCGGKISITIFPDTERKLVKAVRFLNKHKVRFVLLGKGSNVLASDDDFDGVAVVTTKMNDFRIVGRYAFAHAGVSTVALGGKLKKLGLTGGEFLSCLPASVGGAVVTNAGCFGQEMKDIVKRVTVLHCGKKRRLTAKLCRFGKRKSVFVENNDFVILSVKFKLSRSTESEVGNRIEQMRAKKAATQPLNFRSAGSALYHDRVAVSRLIDEAGLKGFTIGGAQVSTKHAGFVINIDKASSKDIYLVIRHIQQTLLKRFGIDAKIEIRLINFNEGTKDDDDVFTGS